MVVVQFFVATLIFAHLVFSSPLNTELYFTDGERQCKRCPPGQYQRSCAECVPCLKGYYTLEINAEPSCHQCFRDCRSEFHLEEVVSCTPTTNVECRCQAGFECIDYQEGNCRDCVIQQQRTPGTEVSLTQNQTLISSEPLTPTPSCQPPRCEPYKGNTTNPTTIGVASNGPGGALAHPYYSLARPAIICFSMVVIVILAFIILLRTRHPGDEACFKQALKFCNKEVREASSNSNKEQSHLHLAGEPQASEKQQPIHPPAPTANMGPVHVYSAGTVVFSLLNQFTGVGGGAEVEDERALKKRDEEGGGCPSPPTPSPTTPHPIPSPNIHLSQEERNGEMECVFFPSQEQGKESHMSKEEGLI